MDQDGPIKGSESPGPGKSFTFLVDTQATVAVKKVALAMGLQPGSRG